MSNYCMECEDKLESFKTMHDFTSKNGRYRWLENTIYYCDNESCDRYGFLVLAVKHERTPKATPERNHSA